MRRGTPARSGRAGGWRLHRWIVGGLLLVVGAAFAANPPERAVAEQPSPDEVEAAYLYNFGKFVRWPAEAAQQPLTICVAGDDSMSEIAGRLTAGEQIDGRALAVKRLERPEDATACSILFVGSGERMREEAYLAGVAGRPVLTVGDGADFLTRGGMIQFVLTRRHVRFAVNLAAAKRGNLQLSSELLKVAMNVVGQPGSGQ